MSININRELYIGSLTASLYLILGDVEDQRQDQSDLKAQVLRLLVVVSMILKIIRLIRLITLIGTITNFSRILALMAVYYRAKFNNIAASPSSENLLTDFIHCTLWLRLKKG